MSGGNRHSMDGQIQAGECRSQVAARVALSDERALSAQRRRDAALNDGPAGAGPRILRDYLLQLGAS
jgi:hypothetical protein